MRRIEYRNIIDKSDWPRGEWDNEPDKVQWFNKRAKLPCMIVRGPLGSLCGYVGVMPRHMFHKVGYSSCPEDCGENYCEHSPMTKLNVHGGLTFSNGCTPIGVKEWMEHRSQLSSAANTAKLYPRGDAARAIKEWSGIINNYSKWKGRMMARSICHVVSNGEPDDVWWFGFDCCHAGDLAPGMHFSERTRTSERYRNISYVTDECIKLANQLARLKTPPVYGRFQNLEFE